jgi:hypothetical protein
MRLATRAVQMTQCELQMQRIDQDQFSDDDSSTLKINGLPTVISEVFHVEHGRFHVVCDLRHAPFEVGEERRVVQSPF